MVNLIISATTQTLNGTLSYDNVSVINGGTLYITPYAGTAPLGTLTLNVVGTVLVDSISSIIGDARGYRGGLGGGTDGEGGNGGEVAGAGGGTSGTRYNTNGGGGGGGGGYASVGGTGGNGMGSIGGTGGIVCGTVSGPDIQMGNGGGAAGTHWNAVNGPPGAAGGAMLTINAANITINGIISCNGGPGGSSVNFGSWDGGGGGGASGGGIKLTASNALDITNGTVRANGGAGGSGGIYASPGQAGSGGRIKLYYLTLASTGATISAGSVYYSPTIAGMISFSSTPSGATVWVDDANLGVVTPYTYSGVAGTHKYRLISTGYTKIGSVVTTAGNTTTVTGALTVVGLNGSIWVEGDYLCFIDSTSRTWYLK